MILQVSGGLEESAVSKESVDGRAPVLLHTCHPVDSELSCEAERLQMQDRYKTEDTCWGHGQCCDQQSAGPLRTYFVYH